MHSPGPVLAGGVLLLGSAPLRWRWRLAFLLWGLPLVWLALTPSATVAYVAFVVVGAGNAIEDVGIFTLLARSASPRSGGRVLGATEFVVQAGLGVGSVAAPWLLHAFGVRGALALLGGGLAVLALAHVRRFVRLDQAMPVPGQEVDMLRLAMCAPRPLAVIELLASDLQPHEFSAGTVAMREGEVGELFYLIVGGSAAVSVQGKPRPPLALGDCFGRSRCCAASRERRPSSRTSHCALWHWTVRRSWSRLPAIA